MAAQILVRDAWVPDPVRRALKTYSPKSELGKIVRECLKYLPADLAADLVDRITSCVVVESSLAVVVFRHPDSLYRAGRGLVEDYGIVSRKVVTTAGVGFIVDAAQNLTELENMKYHGLGTNNTAESASDTTLNTELTTAYNPDNTRATGTTTEGASANIYKNVGTNTVDGSE